MRPLLDPDWSVFSRPVTPRKRRERRRGISAIEVVVITAILGFLLGCVLMVLPRGRETARMAGCQRNLMQIGVAVQLYEQAHRRYPASMLGPAGPAGPSPTRLMLDALTIPDFIDLRDPSQAPKPTTAPAPGARVPGLTCPSDPRAGGVGSTGLSYRANAGDDFLGSNGPFAAGSVVNAAIVEAADGVSFTAGFAERSLGTGHDGTPGPADYREVPGPITAGCDDGSSGTAGWRGDAGASWSDPGWRSALYSHGALPNQKVSCVSREGRTASMGASSSHPGRINVWMLDGSIRGTTPGIDAAVWKALGAYRSPQSTAVTSP